MTELERLLKESLSQTEQLLRNNQIAHSQTLQHHSRELKNLKSAVSTLQAEQAALCLQWHGQDAPFAGI